MRHDVIREHFRRDREIRVEAANKNARASWP